MPESLKPESLLAHHAEEDPSSLRVLSRSPHPYHHQIHDLPHPADRLVYRRSSSAVSQAADDASSDDLLSPFPSFSKDSPFGSDSGTEADDEHFLRGLPAPKARLHKGLRGRNELLSGTSTPLLSPAILEEEGRKDGRNRLPGQAAATDFFKDKKYRRTKELIRRSTEFGLVFGLALLVRSNRKVHPIAISWHRGLC
jgi:hypothetical protein